VFVVGARRSGTNWVQRILAAHPDAVAVPTEPNLFSTALAPLQERFQHGAVGSPVVGKLYMDRDAFLDAVRAFCDAAFGGLLDVIAPDNSRLDAQIGCHDLGRIELAKAGTYHVVVHADASARYAFVPRPIPPDQHFTLRLPAEASRGAPDQGVGRITAPGAQQFYDFTGRQGSVVHLEGKCAQPCPNLVVRVTKAGDSSRLGFVDLMNLKRGS